MDAEISDFLYDTGLVNYFIDIQKFILKFELWKEDHLFRKQR